MTAFPQNTGELSDIVNAFARDRKTIGMSGGECPGGPAAVAVDTIVSTGAMNRIVEYVPSDQIVTAEAGVTLADLQRELGEKQQRLAIDAPFAERLTIGGLVAGNGYGPLRTRYGTLKDVIVGMTIVRADGRVAHGGGKVVKNVAGFDIPKLMIGTYGTLAAIAQVTFRLHPLPKAQTCMTLPGYSPGSLQRLRAAMTQAQLEPSAMTASFDGSAYRFDVRFEGFPRGVEAQTRQLQALDGGARVSDAADPAADAARKGALVVKVSAAPSMFESIHDRAIAPLYAALAGARACAYPSIGVAFVSGEPEDVAGVLDALAAARTFLEDGGGNLVVEEAPPAIRAAFGAWGSPPPSFAVMRSLKDRFDPDRLFNPGGFVGGL
jgi:glycolate oxidase FAD binding subunit